MDLPPPPPGSDEPTIPPPPGASDIPPPGAEVHENDVLKRRKHFSWRSFGGDGFLVSVAFHVLLLLAGLFYVIQKYVEPKKKPDTEIFATGAGGGASGDKAKQFETTMKRKMATPVKTPSRIVSKSATASVSLPSSPTTSTASFASGLASGGMSKGAGGGSGGGEGTGIGIGKGGGRNFVSLFGARGSQKTPGLPGVFFDGKQTPKGKATEYAADGTHWNFYTQVLVDIARQWNQNELERKFFKAPEGLVASQIFIPKCQADSAPTAYGVQDKVKPSRWVAWYRGQVTAPKSGKFRFWAQADDFVSVRWNRKTVIAAKWSSGHDAQFKELQRNPTVQKGAAVFHASPWITVQKGSQYPIEIVISELPGGAFQAQVLMEEYDESKRDGDGKIFLFRMSEEALPEEVKDSTGMNVDLSGKGLIWKATGDKNASGPVR